MVSNGQGHWRIVGDSENQSDNPTFICDWCLDEFEGGADAVFAVPVEVDIPVGLHGGLSSVHLFNQEKADGE